MVMPKRMGEGERERKERKGGGAQGVRIWGHARRRMRGPEWLMAHLQSKV